MPVPVAVRVTVALATTAPVESVTFPSMVALSWPHTRGARAMIIMASAIQSTPIPFFDRTVKLLLDWVKDCVMVCLLRNSLPCWLCPTCFSCSWQSSAGRVRCWFFLRRDNRSLVDTGPPPSREQTLAQFDFTFVRYESQSSGLGGESRLLNSPIPRCESEANNVLKFQEMQGRTAQVPTWFTGEASPTGNEDPYGMNNNERLLTGLSLGNTPGIAGNTEKSYKT